MVLEDTEERDHTLPLGWHEQKVQMWKATQKGDEKFCEHRNSESEIILKRLSVICRKMYPAPPQQMSTSHSPQHIDMLKSHGKEELRLQMSRLL